MWLSGGERGGEQVADKAEGEIYELDAGDSHGRLARYEVRKDAVSGELQAIFVGMVAKVGG